MLFGITSVKIRTLVIDKGAGGYSDDGVLTYREQYSCRLAKALTGRKTERQISNICSSNMPPNWCVCR